ncbi:MAG: creatininase family protein [Fimbriimonas sp.]
MILAESTWKDVEAFGRGGVVLIPTGSLEQHGPHLPLLTDSILVSIVASEVERQLPSQVLLTPTLWLGASAHHLAFPGTLSASMPTYLGAVADVVDSLVPHGFTKFFVLNGHGGNTDPNGMVTRELKRRYANLHIGHRGYFDFAVSVIADVLDGPTKFMRHACEAETSLMLHLRPDLVRFELARNDGLRVEPSVAGLVLPFHEVTEEGSLGYAPLASAEKGRLIFESAVAGVVENTRRLADGYLLVGDQE